jgi:hypothetical protein
MSSVIRVAALRGETPRDYGPFESLGVPVDFLPIPTQTSCAQMLSEQKDNPTPPR